MKTIQKSKEEAARILGAHYGCEVEVTINKAYSAWYSKQTYTCNIDVDLLTDIKYIKSFQILLRSMDEMTEKEIIELGFNGKAHLKAWFEFHGNELFTPRQIDYLRSIGVDTNNLKDTIIEIKD